MTKTLSLTEWIERFFNLRKAWDTPLETVHDTKGLHEGEGKAKIEEMILTGDLILYDKFPYGTCVRMKEGTC